MILQRLDFCLPPHALSRYAWTNARPLELLDAPRPRLTEAVLRRPQSPRHALGRRSRALWRRPGTLSSTAKHASLAAFISPFRPSQVLHSSLPVRRTQSA